jgi:basic membrane protein A
MGSTGGQSKTVKVAMALFGPKNDKSFNQAAYAGLLATAKKNPNVKVTAVLESRNTVQNETSAIQTLAPLNDVVVAVSQTFGVVLDSLADRFPRTYFPIIAGYSVKLHKNVTGFANDWGAPAFVAGAIAATMTKSGVVGYVGGAEIPPTTQAAAGFRHGAQLIKPKIKVLSNIIGDFNDVAKAKQATTAMITDGADVIFPFLDAGIAGSYKAGTESGKNPAMFKLVIPDCKTYPNVVGTEFVNNTAATELMLSQYLKGTIKPGAILLDLQNPTIQTLQLCPKYKANAKVAAVTKRIIAGVNSGKIKLPADSINPRPKYPYREGFTGKTINPGG